MSPTMMAHDKAASTASCTLVASRKGFCPRRANQAAIRGRLSIGGLASNGPSAVPNPRGSSRMTSHRPSEKHTKLQCASHQRSQPTCSSSSAPTRVHAPRLNIPWRRRQAEPGRRAQLQRRLRGMAGRVGMCHRFHEQRYRTSAHAGLPRTKLAHRHPTRGWAYIGTRCLRERQLRQEAKD